MNKNFIWIGPRFSDISGDLTFSNSITTYGTNQYVYCKNAQTRIGRGSKEEIAFIKRAIFELTSANPNCLFLLYDQSEIKYFDEVSRKNFICTNELSIINLLNSKAFTRSWLSNDMACLPFIVMPFSDCSYSHLCRLFPGISTFIVQNAYGVGGTKTYLVESENHLKLVRKSNMAYDICIASPYIRNSVSFNIHILCTENDCILFPYSLQIIEQYNQRLFYAGSNFLYQPDKNINNKIIEASQFIGNKLVQLGYKGIAGIDFLYSNDTLYFIEINPRFQGSTRILNLWLKENSYPSIYKMNIDLFQDCILNYNFSEIDVPYISYNSICGIHNNYKFEAQSVLTFQDTDGWNPKIKCADGTYQFRTIYKITQ